jgi:hypothetical protein
LKLDSFDGSGSPVEAANWLTYVEDKMNAFEVVYGDRVRYGTQLLKGEAQFWWRGVQIHFGSFFIDRFLHYRGTSFRCEDVASIHK